MLRDALLAELRTMRAQSDALFALLDPEYLYQRPIAERHRVIFYVGHLEAFDWNKLCGDALAARPQRPEWNAMFAAGIDPVNGDLPSDTVADWPKLEELRPYLRALRADVDEAIATAPFDGWMKDGWLPRLLIEHRAMHLETLCYMLHRVPRRYKRGAPDVQYGDARHNEVLHVIAGHAFLGNAESRQGWDNEYAPCAVDVPEFRMQRDPVSNADFQRFIDDGGYRDRSLWSEEDWAWRERANIVEPAFWDNGQWRSMFGTVPLPFSSPVYVSHAEASAYARYLGGRLPTEAEWHRAAVGSQPTHVDFRSYDPQPTTVSDGFADLRGNGWEWTSTVFAPFEGFTPLPFYSGYSSPFFDGKHFVLKGGSPRTARGLLRTSFRNWFQPHYPYVYAKFRVVL